MITYRVANIFVDEFNHLDVKTTWIYVLDEFIDSDLASMISFLYLCFLSRTHAVSRNAFDRTLRLRSTKSDTIAPLSDIMNHLELIIGSVHLFIIKHHG